MSFGRKGVMANQSAHDPYASDLSADEIAEKRRAFIASERLRRNPATKPEPSFLAQSNVNASATALAPAFSGAQTRAAVPQSKSPYVQPVGGGMPAQQQHEIKALAGGMANGGNGKFLLGKPKERSVVVAYILWFFLGQLSAHRFYCGQTNTAISQVTLLIIAAVLIGIGQMAGALFLVFWAFSIIYDLFKIPEMLRKFQDQHDYRGVFD